MMFRKPTGAFDSIAFNQVLKNEKTTKTMIMIMIPRPTMRINGRLSKKAKELGNTVFIRLGYVIF
tara:strand:- start:734 stop:928 length:195 start_codon:yes stop_codon:yes gene_type:complete